MRVLLPAVVILLSAGCSTFFPNRYEFEPTKIQNMVVDFEHEVAAPDRAFALFAVGYILDRFYDDFGFRSMDANIYISDYLTIYHVTEEIDVFGFFTLRTSEGVRGVTYPDGRIRVCADRYMTCTSLYHELIHWNVPGMMQDADHEDDRWWDWDARGEEISRELRAIWFEWDDAGWFDAIYEEHERKVAAKVRRRRSYR